MLKSKELQYFVGKVCTIFTHPINRNFKEENPQTYPEPVLIYFIGVVESITDNGLLLQQVGNTESKKPLKSYFFLDKIIGIAEEEELSYDDPKDTEIIEHIKKQHQEQEQKMKEQEEKLLSQASIPEDSSPFINPDAISQMAERLKENFS